MKKLLLALRTLVCTLLIVILAVLVFAVNAILPAYDRMVNSLMNGFDRKVNNAGLDTEGLDLEYNKADYTAETITAAEDELADQIAAEGLVLLKNENSLLPLDPVQFFLEQLFLL